jgi:hypothetical protein
VSAEVGGAVVSYGNEWTRIDSDGHLGVHALLEWSPLLVLLTLSGTSLQKGHSSSISMQNGIAPG